MKNNLLRIGTAGWSIPSNARDSFPPGDSLLKRYSQIFNAVEINSSFHKPHKKVTYERWAATTPTNFNFSVKMPKQITHVSNLVDIESHLDDFINGISGLGSKLGPLLIQLPPSLTFQSDDTNSFFTLLRSRFDGRVVLEPRHPSWGQLEAGAMLQIYNIEYVTADPIKITIESNKKQLSNYYRLHGSPKIYWSAYEPEFLDQLAKRLNNSSWVIFDNTVLGGAIQNALELKNKSF